MRGVLILIFLANGVGAVIGAQTQPPLPYPHESLSGKARDERVMNQLRTERLKVDSAANGGGACQYGTLLGAAQDYAGLNLTQAELDFLRIELSKPDSLGRPIVNFSTFLVTGSEEVVSAALRLLIGREFQVRIQNPGEMTRAERNRAQYTMRIIAGHRNLGDSRGNFIWEPLLYNLESSIKKGRPEAVRYITILPL